MRGDEQRQAGFIVMTSLEDVVPDDHPLRAVRTMVDAALEEMSPELERLYASRGRPSIAPEYLLRAQHSRVSRSSPLSESSAFGRPLPAIVASHHRRYEDESTGCSVSQANL